MKAVGFFWYPLMSISSFWSQFHIEEGNHDDLIAQGGHYAELYNTYFRHQSLEYIESFVG